MTVAPTFLYPTPHRRELLGHVLDGRVFRDAAGEDYLSGERKVSAAVRELEAAGWVELGGGVTPSTRRWTLTPYGRAVIEVRILDFGALASPSIVAEVGDPDEPKVLGHAAYVPQIGGRLRWQVTIGAIVSLKATRPVAWGELWHRACIAHAAAEPIVNP